VKYMDYMFRTCSKLTTIYVSDKWNTASVSSGNNMFLNCTKLIGGNGTKCSGSSGNAVSYTYARVDTASTPGYLTLKS